MSVGAVLLVTACASGNGSTAPPPTKVPPTAAVTTVAKTSSIATSTTTAPPNPDHPFTAEQIGQALLHLTDVPPGFRVGSASQTSALRSICGGAPLLSAVPAVSQADIVFVRPSDGSVISERMNAFHYQGAQAFMVALRAHAVCPSFVAVAAPVVGDQLNQWRFPSAHGTGQVLWFNQGSLVVQICTTGPVATDLVMADTANAALARLKGTLA